ncbi:MAG TPA: lipopolysaccharide assembly protein LapA domain-containing protein [Reyranella sp.]|nr:lipopolysaccharide assembly protein LapA domain-containing protein [Reyranella sp.]
MKILTRALFVLFVLVGALIAVSNSQPVDLTLWPLPHALRMPVYLLVVGVLFLGVAAGLGLGWWGGRHHRRRARERGSEAARLEREVVRLREALAANRPAPPPGTPAARDQRAIDRQAALVAPDLLLPSARSPSA